MELENIQTVASLCCGVIGYSWALKFAMGGHEVYAYNRSEESSARAKQRVKESICHPRPFTPRVHTPASLRFSIHFAPSPASSVISRYVHRPSVSESAL